MVRWEPGARERLQAAALELYSRKGFDETTVSEIAAAVGLTERTFFRHFADKREVLFGGQEILRDEFVSGVAHAADAPPLAIVASAVMGSAGYFAEKRREYSRRRQVIIAANPDLLERELLKMAALAGALAAALRERGVAEPVATLSAESGVTVFRVAFEQWIADGEQRPLAEIERDIFAELGAITAAAAATVIR